MQLQEIDNRIDKLVDCVQFFQLDVENLVREMEILDEKTLKYLQEYQKHRLAARLTFHKASSEKQRALSIGRRLARFDRRFSDLCRNYKELANAFRKGIEDGLIENSDVKRLRNEITKVWKSIRAIRQLALQWQVPSFGKDENEIGKILRQ
jgi:hypothetical protein